MSRSAGAPSHALRMSCRKLPSHVRARHIRLCFPAARAMFVRAYPEGVMQVMNKRRQRLRCSHYLPILEGNRAGQQTKFPCVVYCHGNCGCAQAHAHAHLHGVLRKKALD